MIKLTLSLALIVPFLAFAQEDVILKKTDDLDIEVIEVEEEIYEEIYSYAEVMPQFNGGDAAMYKFLAENTVYPKEAKESGIQGKVFVQFVVKKNGAIEDVSVMRGIGGGCDEEAMRVIKMMPPWVPGAQRGKAVNVHYRMPFQFKLSNDNPVDKQKD